MSPILIISHNYFVAEFKPRLRYCRWHYTRFVFVLFFNTMNLYVHWNQYQLKAKPLLSSFIHWREDHWLLLLKASVNGCSSHWKYTSVVHTGKSWVSTVEHCVWGRCSRLRCLLSVSSCSIWLNTVQSRWIRCRILGSIVVSKFPSPQNIFRALQYDSITAYP